MKKIKFFIIIISLIALTILFCIPTLIKRNKSLVSTNTDEITKISIALYMDRMIIIEDKNDINEFIYYLESLKLSHGSWRLSHPRNGSVRVGMYGIFEDSISMIKDSFYVMSNGTVYKDNCIYTLDDFDYQYFLDLIKKNESFAE